MMTNPYSIVILSAVVFLPALGALALAFFPKDRPDGVRQFSLFVTLLVFLLTVWMALIARRDKGKGSLHFKAGRTPRCSDHRSRYPLDWPRSNIQYFMGDRWHQLPAGDSHFCFSACWR